MATIVELDSMLPRLKGSSELVGAKILPPHHHRDISLQHLELARRLVATNEAETAIYLTRDEVNQLCLSGQIGFYDGPIDIAREAGVRTSGITHGIKGIVHRIGWRELYEPGDSPNLDQLLEEMARIPSYRGMDYPAIKAVLLRKGDDDCSGIFSDAHKWSEQNKSLGCPILIPAVPLLGTNGDQLSSSVAAEPVESPLLSPEQLRKLMSDYPEPDLIHPQALTDAQATFLALRMWFLPKIYEVGVYKDWSIEKPWNASDAGEIAWLLARRLTDFSAEDFESIPHKVEDIKGLRINPDEVEDLRGNLIEYSKDPQSVLSRNQGCGPQLYLLAQLEGIKQTSFDPYFSRFLGVGSLEKDLLKYVQERSSRSRF